MRPGISLLLALLSVSLLWPACSSSNPLQVSTISSNQESTTSTYLGKAGQYLSWGIYHIEIARDGSWCRVLYDRTASAAWGYHMNVVKLLEVSPCTNCLSVGNVHLLSNGNVSADVSITHPFSDAAYTGFDVRGIIIFPASQLFPDNELRAKAGWDPVVGPSMRYSSHKLGDSELANPEGWTSIWAPDYPDLLQPFQLEHGYPIFKYYPGKYASGDNLGTLNAFKRFWSNDTRHMFEAKKTVTRTYIIEPPASGPIEASYAIYAHWAPALKNPVLNPATDFGPEANSPMPYEFTVTQDAVIDPDAPTEEQGRHLHWHIKTWTIGLDHWMGSECDIMYEYNPGGLVQPHVSGVPDDYWIGDTHPALAFTDLPGALPGTWPLIFSLNVFDPAKKNNEGIPLGTDWYILDTSFGAYDGKW